MRREKEQNKKKKIKWKLRTRVIEAREDKIQYGKTTRKN